LQKLPFDFGELPEPLKSMTQNLDPEMIEKMIAMYDPATLSMMMNSVFSILKDSLPPEQMESLKEWMDNLLKSIRP